MSSERGLVGSEEESSFRSDHVDPKTCFMSLSRGKEVEMWCLQLINPSTGRGGV